MKEIPLSLGLVAFVDDEDFEWLNQWKWYAVKKHKIFYAERTTSDRKHLKMHRLILGLSDQSVLCDHIDGNGLNNCRANLRACSHTENMRNTRPHPGFSKYKGVQPRYNKSLKWAAYIRINNKEKCLGRFDSEEEAARHYNLAAKETFGDFARLNDVYPLFPQAKCRTHLIASNSSGFIGVSWHKKAGKWMAYISTNQKRIYIGLFDTPEGAARARDAKASEIRGIRFRLNFP